MSDFILTQVAQAYEQEKIKEFIAEYNSEENKNLTQLGKRELFEQRIFYAYMEGFTMGKEAGRAEGKAEVLNLN